MFEALSDNYHTWLPLRCVDAAHVLNVGQEIQFSRLHTVVLEVLMEISTEEESNSTQQTKCFGISMLCCFCADVLKEDIWYSPKHES